MKKVEKWIKDKKEEKQDKYRAKKAFECYIYRTQTRYTQTNYVKHPYKAKAYYWHQSFSYNEMQEIIKQYL